MNAETFFESFDLLAEAPNSVEMLRELILQLAIQGKLCEQNPRDESAITLLEKVERAKAKSDQDGESRKSKPLRAAKPEAEPFILPTSWTWCQLNDVSINVHYGYTASADHARREIRMLRITDIQNNRVNWEAVPGCDIDEKSFESYALQDNDILIARTGGTIGKSYIVEGVTVRAVFASYLIRVIPHPLIHAPYLKRFLESPFYWDQLRDRSLGTGQPNVNGQALKSLVLPLPPLAEQRRIVSKVDELLGLCDELETRQGARRELRERLVQAALDQLLASRDPADFATHWQRLQTHFDILFDTPEAVERLRTTVLQLGLMGKLVEHSNFDTLDTPEPAVASDAAEYRPRRKSKSKQNDSSEIEPAFDIPSSWTWHRLGDLLVDLRYGTSKKCELDSGGTPVLRIPNLRNGEIDLSVLKFADLELKELHDLSLRDEDLLMIRSNGSTSLVGRSAVVGKSAVGYAYAGYLVRLRLDTVRALPRYVRMALDAPVSRTQIELPIRTTSGVKNINSTEISRLTIPLPPIAAQSKIVARIERLFAICDDLEAKINKRNSSADVLSLAAVYGLLTSTPQPVTTANRAIKKLSPLDYKRTAVASPYST